MTETRRKTFLRESRTSPSLSNDAEVNLNSDPSLTAVRLCQDLHLALVFRPCISVLRALSRVSLATSVRPNLMTDARYHLLIMMNARADSIYKAKVLHTDTRLTEENSYEPQTVSICIRQYVTEIAD